MIQSDLLLERSATPAPGLSPVREGKRPRTTSTNPHSQLDQQPVRPWSNRLIEMASQLPGVRLAPSLRAPHGTVGFHLEPSAARGADVAFMIGREFAHVHPGPDHSLHLTLPEPHRSQAIAAGWAEPHPLAGYPSVSRAIVLVYAPRDAHETAVVADLIRASWAYACGRATSSDPFTDPSLGDLS